MRRSLIERPTGPNPKIGDLVHQSTEHRRPRQNEDRRHRGRGAEWTSRRDPPVGPPVVNPMVRAHRARPGDLVGIGLLNR